jgi:hypothetical protein
MTKAFPSGNQETMSSFPSFSASSRSWNNFHGKGELIWKALLIRKALSRILFIDEGRACSIDGWLAKTPLVGDSNGCWWVIFQIKRACCVPGDQIR